MPRKHVQHYRNGKNTTKPKPWDIEYGELAMTYLNQNEKMYIRTSTNGIVDFSADHIIHDRIDEQDLRMSNALGLSANTESDDERIQYVYTSTNPLLQECHTMNESVEYIADELKNCLDLIETLKANAYMIETGFEVTPNDTVTSENVNFKITNNGNLTVPKKVTVTKSVNDSSTESTLIDAASQATGSTTSSIEGAKERYTIVVEPNLAGAMSTKVELNRYLCYIGTSTAETMTSQSVMAGMGKYVSDGQKVEATVTTNDNEFIYICVPSELRVMYASDGAITVTLNQTTQTITTNLGTFTCYRNYKRLTNNTWNLLIKHQN